MDYILMKNQSPKTEESYAVACKLFIRRFGDVPISSVSFDMAREWREWLGGWQSPDTIRNNIICLRMVLKFLRARGYPVLNYEEIPIQQREKKRVQYLTEEEVAAFITEMGKPCRGYAEMNRLRNVVIVRLLYATGIRNSELCRLNRDSIKNRTFTVVGKSKEEHISFIDTETECMIRHYLSKRVDNNNALFVSHITGNRINSAQLRNIFQVACERSERFKHIHPHTIRHSFATKMLQHKVDLRYIGELMGHQDLNTTKLYTHYSNPELKEIYDNATAY
jgi:integrase/recombinase XerC